MLLGGTCHAVRHLWDADGVAHGERARAALDPARQGQLFVKPFEVRHRRLLWGFRIVFGFVLLGIAIFALSYGGWWTPWFLVGAAADFVLGYRIYRIAQRRASI